MGRRIDRNKEIDAAGAVDRMGGRMKAEMQTGREWLGRGEGCGRRP